MKVGAVFGAGTPNTRTRLFLRLFFPTWRRKTGFRLWDIESGMVTVADGLGGVEDQVEEHLLDQDLVKDGQLNFVHLQG